MQIATDESYTISPFATRTYCTYGSTVTGGGGEWNTWELDPFLRAMTAEYYLFPSTVYHPDPTKLLNVQIDDPVEHRYDFGLDVERFATIAGNVSLALAIVTGRKDHHGEGDVSHSHIDGPVMPNPTWYVQGTSVVHGDTMPVYGGSPHTRDFLGALSGSSGWLWNAGNFQHLIDQFNTVAQDLQNGFSIDPFHGFIADIAVGDFSVEYDQSHLTAVADLYIARRRWFGYISNSWAKVRVQHNYVMQIAALSHDSQYGDSIGTPGVLQACFFTRQVRLLYDGADDSPDPWITSGMRSSRVLYATEGYLPCVTIASNGPPAEELSNYVVRIGGQVDQRKRLLRSHLTDLGSSAYVSSMRAVDNGLTTLNHSFVESISEVSGLIELFPEKDVLSEFFKAVFSVTVGRRILRLAKFAANAYLLYSFGLQDFGNDLLFFAENFDLIAAKLQSALDRTDFRGKFSTVIDHGPFSGSTLITRSKVVMRIPEFAPAGFLMPLSVAGIAPGPIDLWNAAPWSFLVDWFLNIGSRIDLGTTRVHSLFLPVHYCVHSFTMYTSDVPVGNLDVDTSMATYRSYDRIVSQFMPSVKSNQYDWASQAPRIPSLAGGSLFIQNFDRLGRAILG